MLSRSDTHAMQSSEPMKRGTKVRRGAYRAYPIEKISSALAHGPGRILPLALLVGLDSSAAYRDLGRRPSQMIASSRLRPCKASDPSRSIDRYIPVVSA